MSPPLSDVSRKIKQTGLFVLRTQGVLLVRNFGFIKWPLPKSRENNFVVFLDIKGLSTKKKLQLVFIYLIAI